jgi:hypothetical protein
MAQTLPPVYDNKMANCLESKRAVFCGRTQDMSNGSSVWIEVWPKIGLTEAQ